MGIFGVVLVAGTLGAGSWTKAPPLPTPRSAHAVVVAGGAIHVLGGPGTRRVDRFDGRRWTVETKLPGRRGECPRRGRDRDEDLRDRRVRRRDQPSDRAGQGVRHRLEAVDERDAAS